MRRLVNKGKKITAKTARRITGVSSPFGGLQWSDPGPSDQQIVREFILFMEDRRVLYNAMILEIAGQVHSSIHEIREQCTKALQSLTTDAFAVNPIRNIRAASRNFHDAQNEDFRFFQRQAGHFEETPGFFVALGSYRATVGQQVALLAAHYDIDIEGELASVLPTIDEES